MTRVGYHDIIPYYISDIHSFFPFGNVLKGNGSSLPVCGRHGLSGSAFRKFLAPFFTKVGSILSSGNSFRNVSFANDFPTIIRTGLAPYVDCKTVKICSYMHFSYKVTNGLLRT